MSNEIFVEYRVVPVTRYRITKFTRSLSPCRTGEMVEGQGCEGRGEYDNETVAHEVAYALCKAEHDRLGWPIDDERIQYPRRNEEGCTEVSAS